MSVSEQDVERVAELANLELRSGEKAAMLRDLNSVLDYFAQLNRVGHNLGAAYDPGGRPVTEGGETKRALHLRADEIAPSLSRDRVLACAPDTDGSLLQSAQGDRALV